MIEKRITNKYLQSKFDLCNEHNAGAEKCCNLNMCVNEVSMMI